MSEDIEMSENNSEPSFKSLKRRMNGLKNNKRILIKIIFITLCILPFVYQSVKLIHQFLKRETVENISLDVDNYSTIPAITVCYPYFLLMERVVQKYPHLLKPEFDEYMNSFENMTQLENKTITEYQEILYHEHFVESIRKQNLTINQLFKLGLSIENEPIKVFILGRRLYKNKTVIQWESIDSKPIESIVFGKPEDKGYSIYDKK